MALLQLVWDKRLTFLLLLVLQNTSKTLILRVAVGSHKPKFLYSAAVLATEGLKMTLSTVWVLRSGGSVEKIVHFLRSEWRIFVRVLVPAGIYNVQQMLEFVALARLEAPVFSVIVQTKLLTTALFSWTVLGKKLRGVQLVALVLLMVGVILAQMKDCSMGGGGSSSLGKGGSSSDATLGVVATLAIATLSGFAAVYTERVLKHAPLQHHTQSADVLPYMQIQMAGASLLIIGIFALGADFQQIIEYGLWHGFDGAAMVAVVSSALGGLVVSAVLKCARQSRVATRARRRDQPARARHPSCRYADSVLKGYATSASVILTGLLSAMLFSTTLDMHFLLAVVNVTCSIALYGSLGGAALQPAKAAGAAAEGDAESRALLRPAERPGPPAKGESNA